MKIRHQFDKNRLAQMQGRGVRPIDMLGPRADIDLNTALTEFQHKGVGLRPTTVTVKRQLKSLRDLYEDPYGAHHATAICSYPSDLVAKRIAIWLFDRALNLFQKNANMSSSTRTAPLWHVVYGGYADKLRDSDEKPSMLFIVNVTPDSTNFKYEKVRDLLEKYHAIPRIVVGAGVDPLTLFRQRLYYPIDAAVYAGGTGKEVTVADVDL